MAILSRKHQKVFAQSSSNIGQFGSAQTGSKVLSTDVETLQSLSAYLYGWDNAVLGGKKLPSLEEMNALQYVNTYQLAYLFQEGIPEYSALAEYRINSFVKKSGTTEIYKSIVDANIGNALTDATKWTFCGDLSKLFYARLATTTAQGVSYLTPNKNVVINGNFSINQRNVSGTVTLSSGAYGHDRWKAGASGCTYTFATSNNVTTITITAGSLIQVIEGNNLFSDTYCLSWSGTAQGKIGAGSFGATGITGSAVGGTNLNIEFGTGTLSLVQLEKNLAPTPFELRPISQELIFCERYFQQTGSGWVGAEEGSTILSMAIKFNRPMRTTPTLSLISTSIEARTATAVPGDRTKSGCSINVATTVSSYGCWLFLNNSVASGSAGTVIFTRDGANILYASAEL